MRGEILRVPSTRLIVSEVLARRISGMHDFQFDYLRVSLNAYCSSTFAFSMFTYLPLMLSSMIFNEHRTSKRCLFHRAALSLYIYAQCDALRCCHSDGNLFTHIDPGIQSQPLPFTFHRKLNLLSAELEAFVQKVNETPSRVRVR